MRSPVTFLLLFLTFSSSLTSQSFDQVVRAMLDSLSQERLMQHVDALQRAGGTWNRVSYTPGNDSAVHYIRRHFASLPGLTGVQLDTFFITEAQKPYDTMPLFNVMATIPGKQEPGTVVVVGAHLDCSSSRMGAAIWQPQWKSMRVPGADDNASGVAALLELAEVMVRSEFAQQNEHTIIFIAFGAEESVPIHPAYLVGSGHYAANLKRSGAAVRGLINMDMIGFNDLDSMYLNITADGQSQSLGRLVYGANDRFGIGLSLNPEPFAYGTWSDHTPFWTQGFPAVCLIENAPPWLSNPSYSANPYYHKTNDTLETLNPELILRSAQLALASAALLSTSSPSSVSARPVTPSSFGLEQNFPNPFNPATRFRYRIPASGEVELRIVDMMGRTVAMPVHGARSAGEHTVEWNADGLPSGMYCAVLSSGGMLRVRKVLLVK